MTDFHRKVNKCRQRFAKCDPIQMSRKPEINDLVTVKLKTDEMVYEMNHMNCGYEIK